LAFGLGLADWTGRGAGAEVWAAGAGWPPPAGCALNLARVTASTGTTLRALGGSGVFQERAAASRVR